MTNFEKIKKEINAMSEKEFFYWKINQSPWCQDIRSKNIDGYTCSIPTGGCVRCAVDWMKEKYIEPMPKLKTGMFVEANMCGYGVVVNDEIIFQNGTHDTIEDMTEYIIKVFEATCFIDCEDDVDVIWEKNKC